MMRMIARQLQALGLALQFLTIVPTPATQRSDPQLQGLSLLWYPAVGLLLGLLVSVACNLLSLPFYLQAAIAVALWAWLTGGLHLDGLADCADAWVGGFGERDRTLHLLKDPLCGSMGVMTLVMFLVLKCLALAAVIQGDQLPWLWLVPVLARLSLLLLFLTTAYVRAGGLGDVLAQAFPRATAKLELVAVGIITLFILPLDLWTAFVLLLLAVFLIVRWATMSRLGGFTGDVAGAQVELVELALLLALAARGMA